MSPQGTFNWDKKNTCKGRKQAKLQLCIWLGLPLLTSGAGEPAEDFSSWKCHELPSYCLFTRRAGGLSNTLQAQPKLSMPPLLLGLLNGSSSTLKGLYIPLPVITNG